MTTDPNHETSDGLSDEWTAKDIAWRFFHFSDYQAGELAKAIAQALAAARADERGRIANEADAEAKRLLGDIVVGDEEGRKYATERASELATFAANLRGDSPHYIWSPLPKAD